MKLFAFMAIFFILFAINVSAQTDSTKAITQDEFNIIFGYVQRGNIPLLADSLTTISVQTLKEKLDAVRIGKKSLKSLRFTQQEANIIAYNMQADIQAAVKLLKVQQKLLPQPPAANGKLQDKK